MVAMCKLWILRYYVEGIYLFIFFFKMSGVCVHKTKKNHIHQLLVCQHIIEKMYRMGSCSKAGHKIGIQLIPSGFCSSTGAGMETSPTGKGASSNKPPPFIKSFPKTQTHKYDMSESRCIKFQNVITWTSLRDICRNFPEY